MTRSTITPAKTRDIIYQQMAEGYVIHVGDQSFRLACPLCGHAIDRISKTINEHMIALGLGGSDTTDNIRIVHRHCAKKKTNGEKQHMKVDGDKSRIAHTKRMGKKHRGETKPKGNIAKRRDPWNKDFKKKFNGTAERRA